MVLSDWNLSFGAGGRLLGRAQLVSTDSKFAIVPFRSQIKVYSLATRQSVRSIRLDLDLSLVVDATLSAQDPNLMYLFTRTNSVVVVNWREKLISPVVATYNLQLPAEIVRFVRFGASENEYYFIIGKSTAKNQPHSRTLLRSTNDSQIQEISTLKNVVLFAMSVDRSTIAYLTNRNQLYFQSGDGPLEMIQFAYKTPITSLAVSNAETPMIALGTSSGIIQLIFVSDNTRPQRLLKWHIGQINCVEFSTNGAYLLSGGQEKVLVFWHLESDNQQFLPRLNGEIVDIELSASTEELYGVSLLLNGSDREFLVLSAVDLTSRLNVNGVRPKFATHIETIEKDRRRLAKSSVVLDEDTLTKIKHDFSSHFEVHPVSNHCYFPYGAHLQSYDFIRNEQISVITAAPTIQAGKVRSETSIQDPEIEQFAFSCDGKWMCTFDKLQPPEIDNLLSRNDVQYALKFWSYVDGKDRGGWSLSTKIINPHGPGVDVAAVAPAPPSYNDGLAFVTADVKGGLRLWRPRVPKEIYQKVGKDKKLQQTAWTLRKVRNGNERTDAQNVSICWSPDASVIATGQEMNISLIDVNTFEETPVQLPSIAGSRVRCLKIIDEYLVILARDRLVSFDLLTFRATDLAVKVHTQPGSRNLLAVDETRGVFCFCVNYYTKSYNLRSRIFVFEPSKLQPLYVSDHDTGISSVRFAPGMSSFVIVDTDSRIGTLGAGVSTMQEQKELDRAYELSALLNNAKQMASIRKTESEAENERKVLNSQIFEPILDNLEGLPLEALFDRVMKIIV
ncbi:hypothetical protein KL911_003130 [Ogataea haglerorum]|uniref:uncharacterized protein n=1 Tax=Ogataea haglerorum TaxID=1937702 RepID=UPI001C89436B|nr:uncharacterized protein KL911_003130 [Ogataea haglerorum]KAG7747357.1 hypothetical protein KL912_003381 [Ogataea haglerorum]KAG7753025.1 hypothetical protein KL911_003130 [Ogataea haglerorum]